MALKYWGHGQPIGGAFHNGGLRYWGHGQPSGLLVETDQTLGLGGLVQTSTFGTMVLAPGAAAVGLGGLVSASAFGSMSFLPVATVGLGGLVSAEAFGTMTLVPGAISFGALGGLVSASAFGTHVVAGPLIFPSLVGTQAFGSHNVIGPIEFTLPSIHTSASFGNLYVAGPVTMPSLTSPTEAFGDMSFTQPQEMTLPSLVSAGSFGTARVALVQTVTVGGLVGTHAFGTHFVGGPPRFLVLPSIHSNAAFGIMALEGGARTIRLFIGGIDRTNYLRPFSSRVESQQLGRWTAGFDLYIGDGSWAPSLGQTVLLLDFGRRHFAGCLTDVGTDRIPYTETKIFFSCSCVDKNGILDRRLVSKVYPATDDAADILRDIHANFLDGEGLTTNHIPATLGAIGVEMSFASESVTTAFDRIRDITAAPWWVDTFGDIHVVPIPEMEVCPFDIHQTSKNWRSLKTKWTLNNYATEVFARSNLSVVPPGEGSLGPSRVDTFIIPVPEQAERGFVQGSIVLPFSYASVSSIKVNGVEKGFHSGLEVLTSDIDLTEHWWGYPSPYLVPPQKPGHPDIPQDGDEVVVTWVPEGGNTTAAATGASLVPVPPDGLGPLPPGADGTCGSGRYQSVVQVNDIQDQESLDAIAQAALVRKAASPLLLEFETDEPGAEVGQLLNVNLPHLYLPSKQLMITSLSGRSMAVNTGRGSTFRYVIRAVEGSQDLGNYIKWFERLYRLTQHPKPVLQYEEAEFILAPEGSLGMGVISTNPVFVKRTGRLVETWAAFTNPSANQDVLLDVLADGVSLHGSNPLVVPSGTTTLAVTTSFRSEGLYVFQKQILRPSVSFRVLGSNPVAPSQGTLMMRWSI